MFGGLSGIGALIAGTAVVKMVPDFKDFGNQTAKGVSGITSKLGSVGSTLTKAVTLPLVGAGVAAFKFAGDLGESLNKSNVIFGESAKTMERWAQNAAKNFGISKAEALDAGAGFGGLFKLAGQSTEQAAKMSQDVVGLGADLASMFNTSVPEALQALKSGLNGEAEPLRRFNIFLNDAALKAKALELGIKPVNGQFTDQQKILLRQAIIFDQTKDAQGDFARTSESAANKQRILTAQLKDSAATIGQQLIPIGTKLLAFLSGMLDKFQNLPGPVQQVIVILGAVAAAVGPLLIGVAKISSAVSQLGPVFSLIGKGASLLFANPIGLAIAAVVVAAILVWRHWDKIKAALIAIWNAIKTAALAVWNAIKTGLSAIWGAIKVAVTTYFNAYKTIILTIFNAVKVAVLAVWNGIKASLSAIWNAIKAVVRVVWGVMSTLFRGYVNTYKAIIIGTFNVIKSTLQGIWNGMIGAVRTAWNTITSVIRGAINAVMGPINGLRRAVDWLLPGSPVPFVVGLEASAKAMRALSAEATRFKIPTMAAGEARGLGSRFASGLPGPSGVNLAGTPIVLEVHQTIELDGKVITRSVESHQAYAGRANS